MIIHVEGLEIVDGGTDFIDTTFDGAAVDELGENSVPETEADNSLFRAGPMS